MSSLDFRNAVVSSVVEWAKGREDFKVMLENGKTLDFETDESPKVSVEIVYQGSEQSELAVEPFMKDYGDILVTVIVRTFSGVTKAYTLRDELAALLQRKHLGGATTMIAQRIPNNTELKGWTAFRLAVPFTHYSRP